MSPVPARKTDLARRALDSHGDALDLRQRRALILCDGHRTVDDLTRLLGTDTPSVLQTLEAAGYLAGLEPATATRVRPMPAPPLPVPAPVHSAVQSPQVTRRRALSAARIYVQDMLDLQRAPEAQALRAALVGSLDEAATVAAILAAIAGLPAFTTPAFATRVRERVAEVLPERHLPALAALDLDDDVDAVA